MISGARYLSCDLPHISRWHLAVNHCGSLVAFALKQIFVNPVGGQVSIFHLISFSVMVTVGSCKQGLFPLAGLPWVPYCYA